MPDDTYTHGHHEAVLRSHSWRTAENSAGYLLAHLRPGMSVLDVGCGTGTITAGLGRRVTPAPVLGIDRSAEVVARAADLADVPDNVAFALGDVYSLAAEDDSYDVVHAHQVLQHLSDPVAALREMRRVCRPAGVVAVRDADYAAFTWAPEEPNLDRWLSVYRALARSNGAEPDAGRHLKRWAREAGFAQVSASASVWCFSEPEDRAWWGGTWAERVRSSDLGRQAVAGGHATPPELDAMAAAFEDWVRHPDGWFVVLHGEVLASP